MTESPVLTITLLPASPTQKGEYASKDVIMCDAGISIITAQLFTTFRTVTKLDLARNELEVLPDSIGECVVLRILILSVNKLEIIPESIGKCICLEKLFLGENKLRTIPESIGELKLLKTLSIGGNQLETVPNSITKCTNLQIIMALDNRFTEIPIAFIHLPNLKMLHVFSNQNEPRYRNFRMIQGVEYSTGEIKPIY